MKRGLCNLIVLVIVLAFSIVFAQEREEYLSIGQAILDRGLAYAEKGNFQEAIVEFTKAINNNPHIAELYYNRGLAYYGGSISFISALADFNKAIELKPDFVAAYFNRGRIFGVMKNYDEAIRDFNRVIEIDPNNAFAYNAFAYNNRAIGDRKSVV